MPATALLPQERWINLFEVVIAVRRFEDVLMNMFSDTPEINCLADLIADYYTCGHK